MSEFPWQNAIYKALDRHSLPLFSGKTLYITSDYSDRNQAHDYDVLGILLLDIYSSSAWPTRAQAIRKQFLADGRRMEFKSLNSDRHRQAAFRPYLAAANSLTGLCVSVAIRRSIRDLWTSREIYEKWAPLILRAHWKQRPFERLMRIVGFISMFASGLSQPGQDLIWISDEDELFANDVFSNDTGSMLGRLLRMSLNHEIGELMIGTTRIDPGDRGEEDLASLADLVAGASGELLTALARSGALSAATAYCNIPNSLTDRTKIFFDWFSDSRHPLQRIGLLIDETSAGRRRVGTWTVREPVIELPQVVLPAKRNWG
jgi:hypothetical protein